MKTEVRVGRGEQIDNEEEERQRVQKEEEVNNQ